MEESNDMAPSNSVPRPVLMVVKEKAFHTSFSQKLVAMNSEITGRFFYH